MRVLAIGAHPDDLELGCGGTLLRHQARGDSLALLVMSQGEHGPQDERPRRDEQDEAARILRARLYWGHAADGEVIDGKPTVNLIQDVMADFEPDIVYTHSPNDTHQDHRSTSRATLAAGRRFGRILMYEAPTSRGFSPVLHVDIAEYVEAKLDVIRAHLSQVLKNGLVDLEAVEAQARYRGFQARLRYAEAFEVERFTWTSDVPFLLDEGDASSDEADLRSAAASVLRGFGTSGV